MVGSNRSFLAPLAFDFTPRSHRVEQLERSTEVQLVSPRRAFIYIYIYFSFFASSKSEFEPGSTRCCENAKPGKLNAESRRRIQVSLYDGTRRASNS